MVETNKNILIIEDEKPLSHALELKLQHEGFSTTIARNGLEGLACIRNRSFEVVLLDLVMPEMDGFQLLEEIRKLGLVVKIFALSNLSQPEDEERALALGVKKYFIKSRTPLSVIVDEIKQV